MAPCFRISQPMPPPSVRPAIPVWVTIPPTVASPKSCVSRSSSPQSTPASARAVLARGIDSDALHRREVDHQPAVAERVPADAVATGADRDQQIALAREAHRRDHIGHARAAGDAGRMAVNRAIPDPAGSVVAGAGRQQQLSAERSAELVERGRLQGRCLWCLDSGHLVLPAVLDDGVRVAMRAT